MVWCQLQQLSLIMKQHMEKFEYMYSMQAGTMHGALTHVNIGDMTASLGHHGHLYTQCT